MIGVSKIFSKEQIKEHMYKYFEYPSKGITLANGYDFSDALLAASYSNYKNQPLILVRNGSIPESVSKYLK